MVDLTRRRTHISFVRFLNICIQIICTKMNETVMHELYKPLWRDLIWVTDKGRTKAADHHATD